MDEDQFDRRINEFEEAIDESRGYSPDDEMSMQKKSLLGSMPQTKTLILGGAGILLLVILIALFSGGTSEPSKKDLTVINTRIDLLEKRLTRLEEVELRIANVQKQGNMLQQSIGELDRSIRLLTQQVDVLTQKPKLQEKGTVAVIKGTQAPADTTEQVVSQDKRRVHEVRKGENLYRISLKYGLTVDELCRLNNIAASQAIYPGQKLIVAPKNE
ncbi:MAG: LysM peptidoglycan-binding domain-containing protein [Deltaproteobacteria bacterium]|nr:LysM peptidoglycan-binding domain-containing protein [Deltaproteobacteria bacterium]MBW2076127.1 LysM peptidoglycan-binding domain-containing protein [Deltaproteobacteria bacterium]